MKWSFKDNFYVKWSFKVLSILFCILLLYYIMSPFQNCMDKMNTLQYKINFPKIEKFCVENTSW